jgi:hypothetical protein
MLSIAAANVLPHPIREENAAMHKKKTIREVLAGNVKARMARDTAIGTQPLLATRSGVDQGHLSRVLSQKASCTIDFLQSLAHGCRCQAWELLVDDEQTRDDYIRKALGG